MATMTAKMANSMRRQQVTSASGRCRRGIASHAAPEPDSLERLKTRLLAEQMQSVGDAELASRLRRAADESASLAWSTAYPLLTLPELLHEKFSTARTQFEQQCRIQSRGRLAVQLSA